MQDFFIPMCYDLNGMGPIVRADATHMGNISVYGGHGWTADANSPLPALLDSVAQFDYIGVPRTQVVVGMPWCKTALGIRRITTTVI